MTGTNHKLLQVLGITTTTTLEVIVGVETEPVQLGRETSRQQPDVIIEDSYEPSEMINPEVTQMDWMCKLVDWKSDILTHENRKAENNQNISSHKSKPKNKGSLEEQHIIKKPEPKGQTNDELQENRNRLIHTKLKGICLANGERENKHKSKNTTDKFKKGMKRRHSRFLQFEEEIAKRQAIPLLDRTTVQIKLLNVLRSKFHRLKNKYGFQSSSQQEKTKQRSAKQKKNKVTEPSLLLLN